MKRSETFTNDMNTRKAVAEVGNAAAAPGWLVDFYTKVDALDVDAVVSAFAPEGVMRVGSSDPMVGVEAVRDGVTWLCSSYRSISHEFLHVWVAGPATLLEATVTYGLPDGRTVSVPVLTIVERHDNAITNLRFYLDPTPLQSMP